MNYRNIVHVSSLPPTPCGVAEYTSTLVDAFAHKSPAIRSHYIRLDQESEHLTKVESTLTINPGIVEEIDRAATGVNQLERAVVFLQHEFKIFGTPDGENVVRFLAALKVPVITTLHTVWPSFPVKRQCIFLEVLRLSEILVVFSQVAKDILIKNYNVESAKIRVIPHGVPFATFQWPNSVMWPENTRSGVKFISLGLLRPAKGVEHVLAALFELGKTFQGFTYFICGADHPRCATAPEYRLQLESLVAQYGLERNVVFVNRFLDRKEIIEAVQACDVGITPYAAPEQSSSGVLALLLGCGRPVISSDFQFAKATLNESNGIIVPMGDVSALSRAVGRLALDTKLRHQMMEMSYRATRSWVWVEVARMHMDLISEAVKLTETRNGIRGKGRAVKQWSGILEEEICDLPAVGGAS